MDRHHAAQRAVSGGAAMTGAAEMQMDAGTAPEVRVAQGVRLLRWGAAAAQGPVLVFLHGLGDGADIWRPVVRAWPDGPVTALAVDFPGHGGSDFCEPQGYSVPKFAAWLGSLLQREGIAAPVLIGHSMGARVALEASFAGHVRPVHVGVVDVSPDPKADPTLDAVIERHLEMLGAGAFSLQSFRQKIAARMPLADPAVLAEVVPALVEAGGPQEGPHVRMRLDPEIRRLLDAPHQVDGWGALAALGCPATIIRGAFSSALDPETAVRMSRTLRQSAGCVTIGKAGHAIPFEQPVALARALAVELQKVLR